MTYDDNYEYEEDNKLNMISVGLLIFGLKNFKGQVYSVNKLIERVRTTNDEDIYKLAHGHEEEWQEKINNYLTDNADCKGSMGHIIADNLVRHVSNGGFRQSMREGRKFRINWQIFPWNK